MLTVCVNYVIFVVFIKVKILNPICHLKSQRSHITLLTLAFLVSRSSHNHVNRFCCPCGETDEHSSHTQKTSETPFLILIHF